MVQATSDSSNFDADRLSEEIKEGEAKKTEVSEGNFDDDYQLAQEYSTPESNATGTGSNHTSDAGSESSAFTSGSSQPGSPAAFRNMAHEVQPKDEETEQAE
ncbi:hypothetical protein [Pseudanabaena sp. FACHB-2040]|uniref:hypothetical protein n=1 Tax=Pseudanabaena sp. FACHB-2040 TaxID=2692859 RepID=UPI001685964F|nr:hypothetical protein [Pseudanabaena sp. FACHB-2040]MBD2256354.1 hypothetical protein [Pseudanabaena sp. FACHB-2040]